MLTRTRRDGDRYIVFARGADGEERIGFVRGSGRLWQAADTHMEQTADFATRDAAVAWLRQIATAAAQPPNPAP